jgi:transcriptional regulator with XRE-family HTH domain
MEVTAAVSTATYTESKSLAEKVKNHLEATGTSIAALASAINYSRTTVSRYLGGKYDSDTKDIELRLAEYLAKHTARRSPSPELPGRHRPSGPASLRAATRRPSSASANPAKSTSASASWSGVPATARPTPSRSTPSSPGRLIECDDTMSSRDLVEAIEKSLGIPSGYGTIWRRVNGIRDYCNTNRATSLS